MTRETRFALASLVFALLIPFFMTGAAILDRQDGKVFRVDITGYDPRDLLRGHYLMFRYDWDNENNAAGCTNAAGTAPAQGRCCLCLHANPSDPLVPPTVRQVSCDPAVTRQCTATLTGDYDGAQQYFIPEDHAQTLETLLRDGAHDFKMEITAPHKPGPAVIRGLYIDGLPMVDFLSRQPKTP